MVVREIEVRPLGPLVTVMLVWKSGRSTAPPW